MKRFQPIIDLLMNPDHAAGLSTGGVIGTLTGMLTGEKIIYWAGVATAVASAGAAWGLSVRAKLLEQQSAQELRDFVVKWKKEQIAAGKLDADAALLGLVMQTSISKPPVVEVQKP